MNDQVGTVLGIDVGWSEKRKSTCACTLNWTEDEVFFDWQLCNARPGSLENALGLLPINAGLNAAAIDGPLAPNFSPLGVYRTAEKLLTRKLQPHIGKPGQSSSPNGKKLNSVASQAARTICARFPIASSTHAQAISDTCVVEAFPTSFLGVMFEQDKIPNRRKYQARSDAYFSALAETETLGLLISRLLPERNLRTDLSSVRNHDARAAIVCALTALCVSHSQFCAVGDSNGWIILPPLASEYDCGMRPWAAMMIQENADHAGQVHF